jgi:hypothetical protein
LGTHERDGEREKERDREKERELKILGSQVTESFRPLDLSLTVPLTHVLISVPFC